MERAYPDLDAKCPEDPDGKARRRARPLERARRRLTAAHKMGFILDGVKRRRAR